MLKSAAGTFSKWRIFFWFVREPLHLQSTKIEKSSNCRMKSEQVRVSVKMTTCSAIYALSKLSCGYYNMIFLFVITSLFASFVFPQTLQCLALVVPRCVSRACTPESLWAKQYPRTSHIVAIIAGPMAKWLVLNFSSKYRLVWSCDCCPTEGISRAFW